MIVATDVDNMWVRGWLLSMRKLVVVLAPRLALPCLVLPCLQVANFPFLPNVKASDDFGVLSLDCCVVLFSRMSYLTCRGFLGDVSVRD